MTGKKKSFLHKFHPNDNISFFVFRLFFGVSLVYSSLYAKFFHSNLALATINEYHLTDIFPFPPMFFLLGALLIEIMIGAFFIIGFEVRFTSIFFMIFLILSLLYFKEDVWPHFILIGTNLAIFLHGYDKYTLERFMLKKKGEPVL
jgi:uncharacterized membrane protein YphA (DoxX/SURF4 family)